MNKQKIDDEIRQALSGDDVAAYDEFATEQSLLEQAFELLKGRNRWLNIWMMIVTFAFLFLTIFCVAKFYYATEIKNLLGWSIGIGISFGTISMLKLWAWMEMEKNSTVREIKRLELQVARLSKRLDDEEQEASQ